MRVLLIEDDSSMARGIELMLSAEGLNVYTTDLGEEGVDLGKLLICLAMKSSKNFGQPRSQPPF